MVIEIRTMVLEEVLTEKEIQHVLEQAIGEDLTWKLKGREVRPAADGIAGFLGDHMKAVLTVDVEGEEKKVNLFIKRVPIDNEPKAEFIKEQNFFTREKLMYKIIEEICGNDQQPWCVKPYLYTDSIIVLPDLTLQGYAPRSFINTLNSEHVLLTTTSIARFHAAFVNYETKKNINGSSTLQEYRHLLKDEVFCDSQFPKVSSKLSTDLLKTFSTKSYHNITYSLTVLDLQSKLLQLYVKACDNLTVHDDIVNVLLHRDLWVNNIMFKYKNEVPINALLIDFQCLWSGPPAFDLMIFLYVTTDRKFCQEREKDIMDHYYSTFIKELYNDSKKEVIKLGYTKDNFVKWCEQARMFGMVLAITLFPYILMDPKNAQKTFDDPETYEKYLNEDRSEPVIAHCNRCEAYKRRNLEVIEEFVETYVLK